MSGKEMATRGSLGEGEGEWPHPTWWELVSLLVNHFINRALSPRRWSAQVPRGAGRLRGSAGRQGLKLSSSGDLKTKEQSCLRESRDSLPQCWGSREGLWEGEGLTEKFKSLGLQQPRTLLVVLSSLARASPIAWESLWKQYQVVAGRMLSFWELSAECERLLQAGLRALSIGPRDHGIITSHLPTKGWWTVGQGLKEMRPPGEVP
jgi:hypothetical protein